MTKPSSVAEQQTFPVHALLVPAAPSAVLLSQHIWLQLHLEVSSALLCHL